MLNETIQGFSDPKFKFIQISGSFDKRTVKIVIGHLIKVQNLDKVQNLYLKNFVDTKHALMSKSTLVNLFSMCYTISTLKVV